MGEEVSSALIGTAPPRRHSGQVQFIVREDFVLSIFVLINIIQQQGELDPLLGCGTQSKSLSWMLPISNLLLWSDCFRHVFLVLFWVNFASAVGKGVGNGSLGVGVILLFLYQLAAWNI